MSCPPMPIGSSSSTNCTDCFRATRKNYLVSLNTFICSRLNFIEASFAEFEF